MLHVRNGVEVDEAHKKNSSRTCLVHLGGDNLIIFALLFRASHGRLAGQTHTVLIPFQLYDFD